MNYSKFCRLLSEGEKAHVDFKIRCKAFTDATIASKGELAKDICAMANNASLTSYLVVGVSDDRKSFRSVDNQKLTDDNLQDFCKKAISPPPKIRVHRNRWRNASSDHAGKLFVVIQIGPNPRQVFRLSQDFVDYREKVCYRRNEVWIRRGATTDLATPEEVVRLASGQSLREDSQSGQKRRERDHFSSLSQNERQNLVSYMTVVCLEDMNYTRLPKRDWLSASDGPIPEPLPALWKKVGTMVVLVQTLPCLVTLRAISLKHFYWSKVYSRFPIRWDKVSRVISKLSRRRVKSVRRIWVIPVLNSVPASRIESALGGLRRLGSFLYYYQPPLARPWSFHVDEHASITSSAELLILGGIRSVREYRESLIQAMKGAEKETSTLVEPLKKPKVKAGA